MARNSALQPLTLGRIRNFCIIAHIDHGKSTLADRFIQLCEGLSEREMADQVLDSMPIERERGITIKAQSVALNYLATDGERYQLNLIDTPGHVDFSYEVSRSLAACEGALLVIDAAQGVEAQSVANCYAAVEQDLEILPVLNKIDLPSADPQRVAAEIEDIIGIDTTDIVGVSAKHGTGVSDLLELLVRRIPPPKGDPQQPLQALIIDSWFDSYLGVVSLVRLVNGRIARRSRIHVMSTGQTYLVDRVGVFTPKRMDKECLSAGEVGFVIASIKDISGAPVGDTLTLADRPAAAPLTGFKHAQPQVYAGLFPVDSNDYVAFQEALQRLCLNDASLAIEPETSNALGVGFRCGFLGMLHMEIVEERLRREYGLKLITSAPTVTYQIVMLDGSMRLVSNPMDLPPTQQMREFREPIVAIDILTPEAVMGAVIKLCVERRGKQQSISFSGTQVVLRYELPIAEVVLNFSDRLKSISRGYASMDYHFLRYQPADLVRLDILINGDRVDALSWIAHRSTVDSRARAIIANMQGMIPRQMFEVAIQAAIGSRVIARETVKALRKNVTAKCYGGDVTRKRKLIEKQKAGKRRMKQLGKVHIPQEAFLAILNKS